MPKIFVLMLCFALLATACDSDGTPSNSDTLDSTASDSSSTTQPEAESMNHVEGHRGARGLKPESTLPAFETALDFGVTVLEFDLHLLADGELVVWHDDVLEPKKCRLAEDAPSDLVSPSSSGGVLISSLRLDEIRYYQCDLNPNVDRFPDQDNGPTALAGNRYAPVTLGELFDFVSNYALAPEKSPSQREGAAAVQFNMETKRDPGGSDNIGDGFDGSSPGRFELAILAAIDQAGVADRSVIQSFDHRSLWSIRSVDAQIRLSALTSRSIPDFAELADRGADIWSPRFAGMTQDQVVEAHEAGMLVIPWTVNDPDDMQLVLDLGADGFITDRPDIASQLP